jgi:hypothetical protein
MVEHQIAGAHAGRLTRAAEWQAAFDELRDWTAESLEGRDGPGTAWLIIVAGRPGRSREPRPGSTGKPRRQSWTAPPAIPR